MHERESPCAANADSSNESATTEFVALLNEHRSQLLSYIFCLTRNFDDAEDVFQQVSVTLWDKFGDYTSGTNFNAWARSIAKHKVLVFLRTQRRERAKLSDLLVEQLSERQFWETGDEEEKLKALAKCQEKLSEKDREMLSRCYSERGAPLAVAQEMQRSVQSIYNSISRIRRNLYQCIRRQLMGEMQ